MPSEYETLVAALKLTDIPFAEYAWKKRPEGTYGVVSLDFEADSLDGDGGKLDRSWEASVDVFFYKLSERGDVISTVEEVLAEVCGSSWWLNSNQYEDNTGLFHLEWVCEVMDTAEETQEEPPTPGEPAQTEDPIEEPPTEGNEP